MKRGGTLLAVAVLVALTGCSASPAQPLTAETNATESASASPNARAKAMPSDGSGVDPALPVLPEDDDEAFLVVVKSSWKRGEMPSDKKLVSLGKKVCKDLAAGVEHPMAFPGKDLADRERSMNVRTAARQVYCPESFD